VRRPPLHAAPDGEAGRSRDDRASFYLYTLPEEIDRLVAGLGRVREVFG
jgi:selenocysteine lyase/cysteine desulfurase